MQPKAPDDVELASTQWGANCGPAALAAALGTSLAAVREAVSETDGKGELSFRGHMGARQMRHALQVMAAKVTRIASQIAVGDTEHELARAGAPRVVLLQWMGPWEAHPMRAAQHRHWIANVVLFEDVWIYDVNADDWLPFSRWRDEIVPMLMEPKCTGYRIGWLAEVTR